MAALEERIVLEIGGTAGETVIGAATVTVFGPRSDAPPLAREVVHAAVARSVRQLFTHLPTPDSTDESEDVHQARVAARRLRSDLRTFRSLVAADWAATLADELQWFGRQLGSVRDADVLQMTLTTIAESEPTLAPHAVRPLLDHFESDRSLARLQLRDTLEGDRCATLLGRLVRAAQAPDTTDAADQPAADVLPRLARRPWRRLRRAVHALDDDPTDAELHQIRILAKRCRYAAEATEPALRKPARKLARSTARIQDALGDLHDAIVITARLEAAAQQEPQLAYTAGQLAGLLATRAHRSRSHWLEAWQRAERSVHKSL